MKHNVHVCKSNDAREEIRVSAKEKSNAITVQQYCALQLQRRTEQKGAYSPHRLFFKDCDSMDAKKTLLALVIFLTILAILNSIGILGELFNEPISRVIAGAPDKSCTTDSDCVLGGINCASCGCGNAVNTDWKPFCLFKRMEAVCKPCAHPSQFDIKCIDNQCQTVWE